LAAGLRECSRGMNESSISTSCKQSRKGKTMWQRSERTDRYKGAGDSM
jgi:hypothetical protein